MVRIINSLFRYPQALFSYALSDIYTFALTLFLASTFTKKP